MPFRTRVTANVTNNIPPNAGTQIDLAMRQAIVETTRIGRNLTQAATPRGSGPARGRQRTYKTVDSDIQGGGSRVTGVFGSDSEIFEYLESGTRAHIIRPRFKKALFWPGADHPVRMVRHPGTVAQHNLKRSAEAVGELAKDRLGNVFEEVFG